VYTSKEEDAEMFVKQMAKKKEKEDVKRLKKRVNKL